MEVCMCVGGGLAISTPTYELPSIGVQGVEQSHSPL